MSRGEDLRGLNKTLLAKWSWHFAVKRGALWSEVLRGKYGEKEGEERGPLERGTKR